MSRCIETRPLSSPISVEFSAIHLDPSIADNVEAKIARKLCEIMLKLRLSQSKKAHLDTLNPNDDMLFQAREMLKPAA